MKLQVSKQESWGREKGREKVKKMNDEALHSKLETLYLPQSRAAEGERKLAFRFFFSWNKSWGRMKSSAQVNDY